MKGKIAKTSVSRIKRVEWVIIAVVLLLILSIKIVDLVGGDEAAVPVEAKESEIVLENDSQEQVKPVDIRVHIDGAVQTPGVYTLTSEERLVDLIEKAGGETDKADTSSLNLASRVFDGEKIYVPEVGEVVPEPELGALTLGNLNRMDEEQLQILDGVGPTTAQKIVVYREENGPFETIDDLLNVSGIGPKTLERIKAGFQ